jgi:hypothetical protein
MMEKIALPCWIAVTRLVPARLRAVAAEHVHLDRFEVENGEQVDQALGHQSLLGMKGSFPPCHSGLGASDHPGMTAGVSGTLVSQTCFAQL